MSNEVATVKKSPLSAMAARLEIDPDEMQAVIMATVMPNGGKSVTREQFTSFVAVANNYGLDPLKREIYAFPAKGGGIQPVVGIDGWLSIIHSHPDFDGMELKEQFEGGDIFATTCTIYRKSTNHPTVITEYLSECKRDTDPWRKPVRMLRHKATIQCARYAFGLSGIMEQDEAEAALVEEKDITPIDESKKKVSALRRPEPAVEETPEPSPGMSDSDYKNAIGYIESAPDMETLEAGADALRDRDKTPEQRDALVKAYSKRKAEISKQVA